MNKYPNSSFPDSECIFIERKPEAGLIIANGIIPLCGIEIKYSSNPKISKGFFHVIDDLATKQNFIITSASDTYFLSKQINPNYALENPIA